MSPINKDDWTLVEYSWDEGRGVGCFLYERIIGSGNVEELYQERPQPFYPKHFS